MSIFVPNPPFMKSYFFYTLLFLTVLGWAQPSAKDMPWIAQEKKAFEAIKNVQVNANTQNYDVRYHKLELKVNPENRFIAGVVTTHFKAHENLTNVVFDLANELKVTQVKQNNVSASFSQSANQLVIQLPQLVPIGTESNVEITYSGVPPTTNEAFTTSYHNGVPILWTLSQPFGAKDWFPCKDDLQDKVETIDFYITAPSAYTVVANGLEKGQTNAGGGMKTTHFQHNYPIPAYLIAFAVTNYQVFTQQAGTAPNTFPIINYLYPETYNTTVNQVAVTLPIMNLFEDLFGTYPFHEEKYGHAQFGWGGGMEHTTVSFMGLFSRGLIAHELAHHWFGDKVTCATWNHIWLNEGFSEYAAGLVVEHLDNPFAFITWKSNKITNVTSQPGGNLYLTDAQAQNSDRIFSGRLTYDKGAMVVHMLRYVLGDEVFYAGVKNYLNDPQLAFSSVTTDQLQHHLETVSGKNLSTFFANWVYGEGYPSYQAQVFMINDNQAKIILSQTSSHPSVDFFELPVELKITGPNNQQQLVKVYPTHNHEEFVVDLPFSSINQAVIDPNRNIISKNNSISLSVHEVEDQSQTLHIVPNPATDQIDLIKPAHWVIEKSELYDAQGKRVQDNFNWPYSVAYLSKGTYQITLHTQLGVFHKLFIKK